MGCLAIHDAASILATRKPLFGCAAGLQEEVPPAGRGAGRKRKAPVAAPPSPKPAAAEEGVGRGGRKGRPRKEAAEAAPAAEVGRFTDSELAAVFIAKLVARARNGTHKQQKWCWGPGKAGMWVPCAGEVAGSCLGMRVQ
jgi:hypothetical protein